MTDAVRNFVRRRRRRLLRAVVWTSRDVNRRDHVRTVEKMIGWPRR